MKNAFAVLFFGTAIISCNNASTDSVEKADSANEARRDSNTVSDGKAAIVTDKASAEFLVRALDGGLMEVDLGSIAWQKAKTDRVRNFGQMMVSDHNSANMKIRNLAAARTVTLPEMTSEEKTKMIRKLSEKKALDFDREYIDMMVADHREDIKEFESAARKSKDTSVTAFINEALPVLKKHLDSCMAIQKALPSGKKPVAKK